MEPVHTVNLATVTSTVRMPVRYTKFGTNVSTKIRAEIFAAVGVPYGNDSTSNTPWKLHILENRTGLSAWLYCTLLYRSRLLQLICYIVNFPLDVLPVNCQISTFHFLAQLMYRIGRRRFNMAVTDMKPLHRVLQPQFQDIYFSISVFISDLCRYVVLYSSPLHILRYLNVQPAP